MMASASIHVGLTHQRGSAATRSDDHRQQPDGEDARRRRCRASRRSRSRSRSPCTPVHHGSSRDEEHHATDGFSQSTTRIAVSNDALVHPRDLTVADLAGTSRRRPALADDRSARRPFVTVRACPPRCSPCTTRPASSSSPRPARPRLAARVERRHGAGDRRRGLPVTDVADLTGLPAILGHRVVTLHPKVHGGILADLDRPGAPRRPGARTASSRSPSSSSTCTRSRSDPGIELIDIGGPAMVRAAAKNHAHVGVVVDPADYDAGARRAARRRRGCRAATRRRLAREAFAAHRRLRRRDRRRGSTTTDAERRRRRCRATLHLALERAQDAALRREPAPAGRPLPAASVRTGGGTTPCSTAARSSATSTCTTPRRRGGSSTASTSRRA